MQSERLQSIIHINMKKNPRKTFWYSRLIVIFIVAFVLLCLYLGYKEMMTATADVSRDAEVNAPIEVPEEKPADAPADEPVMSPVNEVTLAPGVTAEVSGLSITFNKIVQESRCPVDAQCMEAGAVVASIQLSVDDDITSTNLPSDEVPFKWKGREISIVKIAPELRSGQEIAPKDYRVTFKID